MENDPLVKVVAELDAIGAIPMLMMQFTGVDDISVEVLWTKHLGDDRYEVRNIPMLARRLAFMDIVRVSERDDGRKHVDAVVTKSGFRTINLMFRPQYPEQERMQVLENLVARGVGHEHAKGPFYSIEVGPEHEIENIISFLEDLQRQEHLLYEMPVATDTVHWAPLWGEKADSIVYADVTEADLPDSIEALSARRLDEGRYEICCIPFFALEVALGDHVWTREAHGLNHAQCVVQRSDHWTFHASFLDTAAEQRETVATNLVDALTQLECAMEWWSDDWVAIDAPDDDVADQVGELLWTEMQRGNLTYEAGQAEG